MMLARILAIAIFLLMFAVIMTGKTERFIPALIAGFLVITVVFLGCMHSAEAVISSLNLKCFLTSEFLYAGGSSGETVTGINWSTIVFISGMMMMVAGMGETGFFRAVCAFLAKVVKYKVTYLFFIFMILSAVLSMFIDSITVILFLAAITVELAVLLKFDPVAFIIPEIFCSNLGGAATMSGDPPNIIIGTSLGYTFFDFFKNTGPIAWISLVIMMLYFYLCFRKKLKANKPDPNVSQSFMTGKINKKDFILSSTIFVVIVGLLVTHAQTHLTVAAIGIIAAVLTCLLLPKHIKSIIREFDYKTILFFIGLFVAVSGLEETGVLTIVADGIMKMSSGDPVKIILIIIWISGVCSALVDNIPFAATMVPVIKNLAASVSGMDVGVLAYSLALGCDVGGNATPIGASANVVGTSIAEKNGHKISWGQYCKYNIPATIMTLILSTILILVFIF